MAETQNSNPVVQGLISEDAEKKIHSMLDSSFPVLVPYAKELTISDRGFASYISTLKPSKIYTPSTYSTSEAENPSAREENEPKSRLIDALNQTSYANKNEDTLLAENKMFTDNGDVTFASTGKSLVDAFYELKSSTDDVEELLNKAWAEDPEATLKIIFNARSIHLGKGDKQGAYKALGWLYEYHPQTLLANLIWLARPVIEKKVKKEPEDKSKGEMKSEKNGDVTTNEKASGELGDDDFEMIDEPGQQQLSNSETGDTATLVLTAADAPLASNTAKYDVKYGVAHGYWKDLANILLLAVNDKFNSEVDINPVLNVDNRKSAKQGRVWDQQKAKEARQEKQTERHSRFETKMSLGSGATFKALHLTIARLFASQLRADIASISQKVNSISLAAKWCPSPFESHDKQTFIVSSIAEALYPFEEVCPAGTDPADRTTYLKHARLALRSKILSPLRKHLAIVERDITAATFTSIKYDRIPSLAMSRYSSLFLDKDERRFASYLERVSSGKAQVSGAVLFPSTLVSKARQGGHQYGHNAKKSISQVKKLAEQRLLDGQWKTLVQRIKDSGKIESAIAVCDVSGSMGGPQFPDGTCPMDSAIGLSLLLAEVVEPPFGGTFITFSNHPSVQKAGGPSDTRSFETKVSYMTQVDWGMSTNFVSVFEDLLLPIAVKHKLKQEEMVKKVFVFSDMQFNSAQYHDDRWSSSYERIKTRYADAGYEMPELVFWNLAARTRGAPVEATENGVSLVSGYSQAMLKMFLDGSQFEDEIEEEVVDEDLPSDEEDAEAVDVHVSKKVKKDPLAAVKKAISHPAYAMLKAVD